MQQPAVQLFKNNDTTSETPVQKKENNTGLPDNLKSGIENLSGFSMNDVKVHYNSEKPAQLQAHAYAQGTDIHLAAGQEKHLPHEAWHVVQQKQGRVKPTLQMKGKVNVNDDKGLEREADVMGAKALQMKEEKLNKKQIKEPIQRKKIVAQRVVKTDYGTFDDNTYDILKEKKKSIGVNMDLHFKPNTKVDAKLIGMTQSVRSINEGNVIDINKKVTERSIKPEDAKPINSPVLNKDEGIHIDQHHDMRNPMYATGTALSTDTKLSDTVTHDGWGKHGHRYIDNKIWKEKNAELRDAPKLPNRGNNAEQLFETTAVAIDGKQEGMYYGSVEWGWRTDGKGNFTKIPLRVKSKGTPTSSFMKSAEIWNKGKSDGKDNIALPVQWTGQIGNTPTASLRLGKSKESQTLADLPKMTKVTVLDDSSVWHKVQIDISQNGVVVNKTGSKNVLTGNILRGYVSKELIRKDKSYKR